ncbi:MAG: sulfoxide reductase heme-binding subunit YedZ [Rhodoferax sp.]|nr:sulfoxide reductase heme-binding subunit YedZ [Rhodoferax sp.]
MLRAHVNRFLAGPAAKQLFFFLLLLPLAWLVYGAVFDRLGANPAEALVRSTGDWTLRMLCLVLLVTPLRVVVGLPALARLRRMVGLFVFFYVLLHFFAYGWLDMGLDLEEIAKDIPKRPFILVGFAALLLLTSLAVTSFNAAIRALGAKRWRQLHRAVYAVAALAILHFYWMRAAKQNFAEVAVYAAILAVLLGWRLWSRFRRPAPRAQTAS